MYALGKMKIAKDSDIKLIHHKHLTWGNVIFEDGMEENRATVRSFLKSNKNSELWSFW